MNALVEFFLKRSSLFLFLLLELFCAFLVINYGKSDHQRRIFIASTNFFAGKVYYHFDKLRRIANWGADIDSLSNENAQLRNQLPSSHYVNIPYRDTVHLVRLDSIGKDSVITQYVFLPAGVINNSLVSTKNYFTLNKGGLHGIDKSMGVIGTHGVAGIVSTVSPHFARVMSILNRDANISALVLAGGKGYFGTITWDGRDVRFVNMNYVPKSAPIQTGDSVVTSGYSTIFPPDQLIGTVDTFNVPSGSPSYQIRVRLAEDMTSLRRVYVIENLMKDEIKQLEAQDEQ